MTTTIPRPSTRRRVVSIVVPIVLVLAAAGIWVWQSIPDVRTEFLIDTSSMPAGQLADIGTAVSVAASNAGNGDSMSLRAYGGRCGDSSATTELVSTGTDQASDIARAAVGLRPAGAHTLVSGIDAAVEDFGGWYPFRGSQLNRVVVVTGHGQDACSADWTAALKDIHDKIAAAGLDLEFRFVGYQVSRHQTTNLAQVAEATGAPAPTLVSTRAELTATLRQLTLPPPPDASKLHLPPTGPSGGGGSNNGGSDLVTLVIHTWDPDTSVSYDHQPAPCKHHCESTIPRGTQLTLRAADPGSIPMNWVGCSNPTTSWQDPCHVKVTQNVTYVCVAPYDPYLPPVSPARCMQEAIHPQN